MEILKKLFGGRGYIDGITIINLQGEILFSAKFNEKLGAHQSSKELVGKNFYDVYENLSPETSTIYKAMQVGMPAYVENQYLEQVGRKGIRITSLSIPIKSGNRIVGAIDLSMQAQSEPPAGAVHINLSAEDLAENRTGKMAGNFSARFTKQDIIAVDEAMVAAREYIDIVAGCNLPVMIYGETGTGKEMFAQAIHNASDRKNKPFVAQNCAAIPETLLESILFGTSKGAFTGAVENVGLLEQANGGTLFLDEINSMPLNLQSKLLRVLQEGRFCRLGAKTETAVDVRFVTALNTQPLEAIEAGDLRRDIYYRLAMMSITIPPLRQRKKDIPAFVEMYVKKHNQTFGKQIEFLSAELIEKLQSYSWPGNVRELEQVVVYGVGQAAPGARVLQYEDIEEKFTQMLQADEGRQTEKIVPELAGAPHAAQKTQPLRQAVAQLEQKMLADTLQLTGGNLSRAAKILEIPRQTLQRKVQQYGIEPNPQNQ